MVWIRAKIASGQERRACEKGSIKTRNMKGERNAPKDRGKPLARRFTCISKCWAALEELCDMSSRVEKVKVKAGSENSPQNPTKETWKRVKQEDLMIK
jgi:hypothetical protein